jgi:hypothetical protein
MREQASDGQRNGSTYDGGGGDAPLMRDALARGCPVGEGAPAREGALKVMLAREPERSCCAGRLWSATTCSMIGSSGEVI